MRPTLAKALGFLVVTPVTALLFRFFAPGSGSSVTTDVVLSLIEFGAWSGVIPESAILAGDGGG